MQNSQWSKSGTSQGESGSAAVVSRSSDRAHCCSQVFWQLRTHRNLARNHTKSSRSSLSRWCTRTRSWNVATVGTVSQHNGHQKSILCFSDFSCRILHCLSCASHCLRLSCATSWILLSSSSCLVSQQFSMIPLVSVSPNTPGTQAAPWRLGPVPVPGLRLVQACFPSSTVIAPLESRCHFSVWEVSATRGPKRKRKKRITPQKMKESIGRKKELRMFSFGFAHGVMA